MLEQCIQHQLWQTEMHYSSTRINFTVPGVQSLADSKSVRGDCRIYWMNDTGM